MTDTFTVNDVGSLNGTYLNRERIEQAALTAGMSCRSASSGWCSFTRCKAVRAKMAERSHLSIGEVLSLLREEFPDVTISKIRFLESQGLVDPERTPSGYRKFYEHDVERLDTRQQREHWILAASNDENFLEGAAQAPSSSAGRGLPSSGAPPGPARLVRPGPSLIGLPTTRSVAAAKVCNPLVLRGGRPPLQPSDARSRSQRQRQRRNQRQTRRRSRPNAVRGDQANEVDFSPVSAVTPSLFASHRAESAPDEGSSRRAGAGDHAASPPAQSPVLAWWRCT
jgi:hypothetical protein